MLPQTFLIAFNNYIPYFIIIAILGLTGLLILFLSLRNKIKKIFCGESMDLEKVLIELRDNDNVFAKGVLEIKNRVRALEEALPKDIRKVGLVRYNPFSDAGGDQSFALALLNENKDGIVISSLYGREMNRVYAKPIENGNSKYQLSEEEKAAIQNAK